MNQTSGAMRAAVPPASTPARGGKAIASLSVISGLSPQDRIVRRLLGQMGSGAYA